MDSPGTPRRPQTPNNDLVSETRSPSRHHTKFHVSIGRKKTAREHANSAVVIKPELLIELPYRNGLSDFRDVLLEITLPHVSCIAELVLAPLSVGDNEQASALSETWSDRPATRDDAHLFLVIEVGSRKYSFGQRGPGAIAPFKLFF